MTKPLLPLPSSIESQLQRLRSSIRAYVLWELLAISVLWLVGTFWLFVAVDYLPVRAGFGEMPRVARIFFLVLIAAGLAWILFRWGWRPASSPLTRSRLAVLYERFFPELGGTLVGAVELSEKSDELATSAVGLTLANQTLERANQLMQSVDPQRIFDRPRLRRRVATGVVALVASLAVILWQPGMARLAWARLYGLSDRPWPRLSFIEVLNFEDHTRKVAVGGSVEVRVRADANRRVPPPDSCTIYYSAADGSRGAVVMSRDGEERDGYQYYVFRGKPFQGIQDDLALYVVGGDYRTDEYRLLAVDLPSLVRLELVYQPPDYTHLVQQRRPWTPGMRVPQGAEVELQGTSSKPLKELGLQTESRDRSALPSYTLETDPRSFRIPLGKVLTSVGFDLTLLDQDGINSQQPYAIRIQPIEDQPPELEMRVLGIGNAITPDAKLPYEGKISDDYDVREAWFQLNQGERDQRIPVPLVANEELKVAVDFRDLRAQSENPWTLEPGQEIQVALRASDYYDLTEAPHEGSTDQLKLQVVRPEQLLAILEARELSLRRRFEDIVGETTEQQDSLFRLQASLKWLADHPEPGSGDATKPSPGPNEASNSNDGNASDTSAEGDAGARSRDEDGASGGNAEETNEHDSEAASLRELRLQRLIQFDQKVASELAGLAAAFEDILLELDNNRVNSAEREQRLRQLIVEPLKSISENELTRLDSTLRELEKEFKESSPAGRRAAAARGDQAVQEMAAILVAMQEILNNMLKMESFNEVLDLLRNLMEEQQKVLEKTQEQQKSDIFEGILPE